jgi:hypothetical protein
MGKKAIVVALMFVLVGAAGAGSAAVAAERSGKQKAVLIGGSTAAGAVLGGLLGGKKGAISGAIAGGSGAYIYDRATRDRYGYRSGRDKLVTIGGSTAAGAAVGGIAGGMKGAVIGGAIGAAGGYILHKKTDPDRRYR